jgi:hypothetical protein
MSFFKKTTSTREEKPSIDDKTEEKVTAAEQKLTEFQSKTKDLNEKNPISLGKTLTALVETLFLLQTELEIQTKLNNNYKELVALMGENQNIIDLILKEFDGLETQSLQRNIPLLNKENSDKGMKKRIFENLGDLLTGETPDEEFLEVADTSGGEGTVTAGGEGTVTESTEGEKPPDGGRRYRRRRRTSKSK